MSSSATTFSKGGAAKRGLTGRAVLLSLVGFFGVDFAVNGLMVYSALSTFRGEVTEHPYESGIAYNSQIDAAAAQAARQWHVDVHFAAQPGARAVRATFLDKDGAALAGLKVRGVFASPADLYRDEAFDLQESEPGVYVGAAAADAGVWDFKIEARRGGEVVYRTKNRVTFE